MRLLILGGTVFLGRHAAEQALERGHELTLFTRGQTNAGLFPDAEHLRGDRDATSKANFLPNHEPQSRRWEIDPLSGSQLSWLTIQQSS